MASANNSSSRKRIASDCEEQTTVKKTKRVQKYKQEYTLKFPVLVKSSLSDSHVFCKTCKTNFSISNGGLNDCTTHVSGPVHRKKAELLKSQPSIAMSFGSAAIAKETGDGHQHDVMSAEMHMMRFFVEHNIPMAAADHCGPLFRKMFPNDPVAKDFKCARTKMTALVKHESKKIAADISSKCSNVFTISSDGSNEHIYYQRVFNVVHSK